jgi:RimJ/RimL family protein N-acetyltransferase
VPILEITRPIETDRLLLRPFATSDEDAMLAIYSREDVARYLYQGPRDRAAVRGSLAEKVRRRAISAEGDGLALAVVTKESGSLVGDVVLQYVSEQHRQVEIGFVVHPDHQGLGYATEAVRVLLGLAFDGLGAHRVFGRAEGRNEASARVMEKLGMRREALLVENEWVKDEWQSELVCAILDREWRRDGGVSRSAVRPGRYREGSVPS